MVVSALLIECPPQGDSSVNNNKKLIMSILVMSISFTFTALYKEESNVKMQPSAILVSVNNHNIIMLISCTSEKVQIKKITKDQKK